MAYNFLPLLRGASMCSGPGNSDPCAASLSSRRAASGSIRARWGSAVNPIGADVRSPSSRCGASVDSHRGAGRHAERPADQEFKTWGRHNRMRVAAGEL